MNTDTLHAVNISKSEVTGLFSLNPFFLYILVKHGSVLLLSLVLIKISPKFVYVKQKLRLKAIIEYSKEVAGTKIICTIKCSKLVPNVTKKMS